MTELQNDRTLELIFKTGISPESDPVHIREKADKYPVEHLEHNPVENEQQERDQTPEFPEIELRDDENVIDRTIRLKTRRALSWVIVLICLSATAVFAYRLLHVANAVSGEPPALNDQSAGKGFSLAPEQIENIAVEIAQKHVVSGEVKSPGKIGFNTNQTSPVLPQFAGRLVKLSAEVGDKVRAGQVLGTIETPDIIQPQSDYQQGLANERTAITSLEHAERTRERDERLTKIEAIPLRELQQAQVDEKHAREDLERAQQAKTALLGRLQALRFGEVEIKTLQSGGHVLRRQVELLAPISGTVIERKAGIGQALQPGGDPLFQIANLANVWVNAEVYEDQLAHLHIGLPATIETPSYPDAHFTARIDQIGNVVDPDKRTVSVRCVLSNADGKFKPGMFVNVSLGGVSNLEVITVPATAVVTEGEKRVVFVETERGHYDKREITIGDEHEATVIVKTGLKEGERVVTKGSLLVAAAG